MSVHIFGVGCSTSSCFAARDMQATATSCSMPWGSACTPSKAVSWAQQQQQAVKVKNAP